MTEPNDIADVLREHPAVADAVVTGDTAHLVPDPAHAALLRRAVDIEAAGRLGHLDWHEPADDLRVAGVNRGETDFLHREIFIDDAYFPVGFALPPGAVVIDAGANVGMFTLRVARHSPGARILAVEPIAELAAAVAVNGALHDVDVTVVNLGLGRAEAEVEFTFYPNNTVMSGHFADPVGDLDILRGYLLTGQGAQDSRQLEHVAADRLSAQHRRIRTTTLTRIADEYELVRIDLLKIDVEKAEADVLAGIDDALWPRIDRIAMEVHDIDGRLELVLKTLRTRGFTVTCQQDPRLVRTGCHNVFAQRPEAVVTAVTEQRVAGGPTLRKLARELRELLSDRLPDAVAPSRFELVADTAGAGTADEPDAGPPTTQRTEVLAEIWAELFGPESVYPDANFFGLGGDSLTAVRLLTQVEERLGEGVLAPDMIFLRETFGALAAALEASALTQTSGPA
jgi:FkbM family methyltransferase